MTEPLHPDDADLLAAELALGVLEGDELRAAELRAAGDSEFASLVLRWQERTTGWLDGLDNERPPSDVWSRLGASLDLQTPANDSEPSDGRARYWRRVALGSIAASFALAIALAGTVIKLNKSVPAGETESPNPNVAQISTADGTPLISAVYYAEKGTMLLRTAALHSTDKAPELWVLDAQGVPHSLGLIDSDGTLTITLSQNVRSLLADQAILAITLEDREGAPHEAPSGEILGTAKLTTL